MLILCVFYQRLHNGTSLYDKGALLMNVLKILEVGLEGEFWQIAVVVTHLEMHDGQLTLANMDHFLCFMKNK